MPSKYSPIGFEMSNEAIPKFTGVETVDCPSCGYRIPVREEWVDYRRLYEEQHDHATRMYECFNKLIDDMSEEVPEVKIYLHNQKMEITQRLEDLSKLFRDSLSGKEGDDE